MSSSSSSLDPSQQPAQPRSSSSTSTTTTTSAKPDACHPSNEQAPQQDTPPHTSTATQQERPSHASTDPELQTHSALANRGQPTQEAAKEAAAAVAAEAPHADDPGSADPPKIIEGSTATSATSSTVPVIIGSGRDQHDGRDGAEGDGPGNEKKKEEEEEEKGEVMTGKRRRVRKPTLEAFSLQGKVSVVTGGAGGLGLVMAAALLESGARVALVDLNIEEAKKQARILDEQYKDLNDGDDNGDDDDGGHHDGDRNEDRISRSTARARATAHYADVSSPSSIDSCMDEIVDRHGQIDHLVTSAGFTENFAAVSYPHERMQKLWAVNVDGTYLAAVAVARHLMGRRRPGSVVFIGSMSGAVVNVPQPQAPYNASKAAVRQLAASLAVEWAPHGIRVNCISPGYMETALTKKILDEKPELREKWTSLVPQGRLGDPKDLMGVVVFLASDASAYVTGADLRVDGGYTVT